MIKKIDHVVITSKDLTACGQFYEKLGFKIINCGNRLEMFAGDFKINVHKNGQELLPHAKYICVGGGDLCFEVDDLKKFIKLLEEQNIAIELGIVSRSGRKGAMNSIYIRDLDGNLLEFSSYES